ncbi:MAG: 3-deoxy-D-manno-octulosonic acid transferase, partial [Acetobacteraceae bacterium]|nr:3-deoxy-D-manno-octulosonic acid transferase [Acetobacteraceae bacterium]
AGFVESELWPNMLAASRLRGVPVMLLNGRLSDRSFARWRRAAGFAREVLSGFDRLEAQSEADAERFRALGAAAVSAPGNLKFAAPPLPVDGVELARLRALLGARPVWLAASTHPGEETLIAEAHRRLVLTHPRLLTIIAPRHPERGARLAFELAGLRAPRR